MIVNDQLNDVSSRKAKIKNMMNKEAETM